MPLRALLLAYEFPPLASSGVHRALGFAQWLPESGIELDVVTVRAEDYPAWTPTPIDPALLAGVPTCVRVHRIPSGFPSWYWSMVRSRVGRAVAHYGQWGDPVAHFWRAPLFALLDRLIAERRPDVLLATVPPFGVAVLAREVADRYALPWVVDFRDPWTRWCPAPYPTVGHYLYARRHESATLRRANATIATSHVTRDDWLAHVPGVSSERIRTIYNGFDGPSSVGPAEPTNGTRHLVHVGNFYYTPEARDATFRPVWRRRPDRWLHYRLRREDWLYRSPYFFLRGLRLFLDRHSDLAGRLRVTFAGQVPAWLPAMLAETATEGAVVLAGPVSHAESLRLQRDASALLLTSAKVENRGAPAVARDYSVAGKLIEYFGARRPILGVLTDGAMRDLVEPSGMGVLADPDDLESVVAAIERVVTAETPDHLVRPDEEYLQTFERRRTVEQVAECLRAAVAEGYRG